MKKQEWFILITLALLQFTYIVEFIILAPMGSQLMRLFSISPKEFGLLLSMYAFSAGLSGFFAASVVDFFDRKTFLVFIFTGFLLGTLCCGLAPGFMWLVLARTVTGAFGGVINAQIFSIIGDIIPFERRGKATGFITASFSLASVAGVPSGLYLAQLFGWQAPFYALSAFGMLVLALILLFIPPITSHLNQGVAKKPSYKASFSILKTPNQLFAMAVVVCLVMGQFAIFPFFAPFLVRNVGFTESQLPLMYLAGGISMAISSPIIGKMVDKFGSHTMLYSCTLLSLIPIILITHLSVTPVWIVIVITVLQFTFVGGRMIAGLNLMNSTVIPQQRGTFFSLGGAAQQIGGATSSFLSGSIITTTSLTSPMENFPLVGYIAVFLSILSLILAYNVRRIE